MHMAIAEDKSISVDKVLAEWRERGIRNVRVELPDMHGTSRSKIVPIDHAASYAKNGLNMYGGAAVLDTRSDVVPGTLRPSASHSSGVDTGCPSDTGSAPPGTCFASTQQAIASARLPT